MVKAQSFVNKYWPSFLPVSIVLWLRLLFKAFSTFNLRMYDIHEGIMMSIIMIAVRDERVSCLHIAPI